MVRDMLGEVPVHPGRPGARLPACPLLTYTNSAHRVSQTPFRTCGFLLED
ncbi:hypothetical protein PG995_011173 [Apiospora arundinis]